MKYLIGILLNIISISSMADISDCQNLYVGRIWVERGEGLKGVVLLNDPNNTSGSYWLYFAGWGTDDKKSALSILTTAKIAQHRINVVTEESNGCNIQTGQRIAKSIYLSNNP